MARQFVRKLVSGWHPRPSFTLDRSRLPSRQHHTDHKHSSRDDPLFDALKPVSSFFKHGGSLTNEQDFSNSTAQRPASHDIPMPCAGCYSPLPASTRYIAPCELPQGSYDMCHTMPVSPASFGDILTPLSELLNMPTASSSRGNCSSAAASRVDLPGSRQATLHSRRGSPFSFIYLNRVAGRPSYSLNSHFCVQSPGRSLWQSCTHVRFSSTATGERLEDDIGSFSSDGSNVDGKLGGIMRSGEDFVVTDVGAVNKAGEVAAIIGDCSYPTAFLQLLIEKVHLYSGLPWWASIVATTIVIRVSIVPIIAYQIKSTAKLTLMRPELEKINAEIKDSNYDPRLTHDARQRIKAVFKRHNTSPFAPFIGAVLQAPVFICFFFAVRNMAERVESFKLGGFLYFTDLSTADSTYILPLMTSLSLLTAVELGAAEGMEGNPVAGKLKNFMRLFAAITFPLTLAFEKAIFFYWITSNCWTICQTAFFRRPAVKSFFGIPNTKQLAQPQALLETVVEPGTEPVEAFVKPSRQPPRPMNRSRRKQSKISTKR